MTTVSVEKEKLEEMLQKVTDLVAYIEHETDFKDDHLSRMALDLYDNIFVIAGDEDEADLQEQELNHKIYTYTLNKHFNKV